MPLQERAGPRGAGAAAAVDEVWPLALQSLDGRQEPRVRDARRALDVPGGELLAAPHVQERVGTRRHQRPRRGGVHLLGGSGDAAGSAPCFEHRRREPALHPVHAHAHQEPNIVFINLHSTNSNP